MFGNRLTALRTLSVVGIPLIFALKPISLLCAIVCSNVFRTDPQMTTCLE
jgi:hypothetical protein